MRSLQQQVGGHGELHAGARPQQRGVVADAERNTPRAVVAGAHVARGLFEIPANQLKFGGQTQTACRRRAISPARSSSASFSSTPLTNLWPSVPPKLRPSSIASFKITLNGVSGRAVSS